MTHAITKDKYPKKDHRTISCISNLSTYMCSYVPTLMIVIDNRNNKILFLKHFLLIFEEPIHTHFHI